MEDYYLFFVQNSNEIVQVNYIEKCNLFHLLADAGRISEPIYRLIYRFKILPTIHAYIRNLKAHDLKSAMNIFTSV